MDIAGTKHGVCVIQKCQSEGDKVQRKKIYDLILQNFDGLMKDPFGNYLIQYILINFKDKEKFMEIMPIINKIEENFVEYAKDKFAANVIEKCFENDNNDLKEHILEYFFKHYKDKILEILLDQYGIYIIQKALNLDGKYKKKMINLIKKKKKELQKLDLNDFKYRGVLYIISMNTELSMILSEKNESTSTKNNSDYNYYNGYNNGNYYYNDEYNKNVKYNCGKKRKGKKNQRDYKK